MIKPAPKTNKPLSFFRLRQKSDDLSARLPSLKIDAKKATQSILSGEHNQRKSGTGEKFWQYREYMPGDRPQDIDWRQSAKGDRVFVRQKEQQTTQTAIFWCQNNHAMDYRSAQNLPRKNEAAIIMALTLATLVTRSDEQIALLDGRMKRGRTEHALTEFGEILCRQNDKQLPNANRYDLPKNAALFVIGDFLAELDETKKALQPLIDHVDKAVMIQVLDPAELNLPFSGHMIFQDHPDHEKHQIMNVETVRKDYQNKINEHNEALRSFCRKNRWQYFLHTTDIPVEDTLNAIWLTMDNGGTYGI